MKVMRLTTAEWAALGVVLAGLAIFAPWIRSPREVQLERKIDALYVWADAVSQAKGWPRPYIPERPIVLPEPKPAGTLGPYAAEIEPNARQSEKEVPRCPTP